MAKTKASVMLMFQGDAQAALDFYAAVIPGAQVEVTERYAPGEAATGATVKRATLRLPGLELMVFDSPVKHAFGFTASISVFLDCEDEAMLDRLFQKLSEGGQVFMAPANYGFSPRFTWVSDRFGVSWQLNLPA
jgi:predicted 3-demethylubiquinone-9 3-methyltransferase (glyoxalase superfamily)